MNCKSSWNFFQDGSARYMVSKGVDLSKVLIGVSGYGRCFILKSPEENGIGAPVTGPCKGGEFTRKAIGTLSYFEVEWTIFMEYISEWSIYNFKIL